MGDNSVHLVGRVKRDAEAASLGRGKVLDFAVEVEGRNDRTDVFDCRMTSQSRAFDVLDGFVEGGEEIEVIGHLEKQTTTRSTHVCGVSVEVKNSRTVVYVDDVITKE